MRIRGGTLLGRKLLGGTLLGGTAASLKARLLAARSLNRALDAGIPLIQALKLTAEHSSNRSVKHALRGVAAELARGQTIVAALRPYRGVLTEGFTQAIVAGSVSGQMEQILAILINDYDFRLRTRREIIAQATYPMMIVLSAVCGIPIMTHLWLGEFDAAFARRLVTDVATILIYIGIAITILGLAPVRRIAVSVMTLLWPTSMILLRLSAARLLNGLAAMLIAGYPNHVALEHAIRFSGNPVLGWKLRRQLNAVRNGQPISEALARSGVIPREHRPTLQMAEYAGSLEHSAESCAEQLYREARHPVAVFVNVLQAFLIIAVGLFIVRSIVGVGLVFGQLSLDG